MGRDGRFYPEYFEMSSEMASLDGICARCLKRTKGRRVNAYRIYISTEKQGSQQMEREGEKAEEVLAQCREDFKNATYISVRSQDGTADSAVWSGTGQGEGR